jgi:hypothetical protein
MLPPLVDQDGTSKVSVGGMTGPIFKLVIVQLSVAGLPTGTGGAWVFELTVMEVEEVQPLLILVTNKV